MQGRDDRNAVKPIEYLGGVMDEETRPLLKSYITGLKDGEGALVVFRLGEGDSSNVLLESDINQIAGHEWNYVTGKNGNSPMQNLVDTLSADATKSRVANSLFSQGSAKVKAFDAHQICFGLIGKGDGEITSIKGIVHQQLNMGLNGDLLMHEGDIIMQSLVDNGVFNEGIRQRPLRVLTYGAGGSASEQMNPGTMAVSDGVIDIRTHVDPRSTMEFLEKYCSEYARAHPSEKGSETYDAFNVQAQMIKHKIKDDPGYSGIAMVHDMAELVRRASVYTGNSTVDIMSEMDSKDKRYYGEITFGTPYYGTNVAHRITKNADGIEFSGDDGQKQVVGELQNFITKMGKTNPEEQKNIHEREFKLQTTFNELESKTQEISKLLTGKFTESQALDFEIANNTIRYLYRQNDKIAEEIMKATFDDMDVISKMEKKIITNDVLITRYCEEKNELMQSASGTLTGDDKLNYERLNDEVNSLSASLNNQSLNLVKIMHQNTELVNADKKLRFFIDKSKSVHDEVHPGHEFAITACGNIFFTEHDKTAVGRYGAQLVEMENSLFVEIIHHSIANQLYVDKQFITKIAADPLKIEDHVSGVLNHWASTYTMSVDDYVDAFMWANSGQSFSAFPESGRWTVAEDLFKSDDIAKTRFYNFGKEGEVKIVNPFWKEIGTDLVKEIKDGKAFQGKGYAGMDFGKPPLQDEKKHLQDLASLIIANPEASDVKKQVKQLFSGYLQLMKPMQVKSEIEESVEQEPRYRTYARTIPVLQAGFLSAGISDWDQPIYKSSNTALLDDQAAGFLARQGGKVLAKDAITKSSERVEIINFDSANLVIFKMYKEERQGSYAEAIALGKDFLDKQTLLPEQTDLTGRDKQAFENARASMVRDNTKISGLIEKCQNNLLQRNATSYPSELHEYVRQEKITGPRIARAIEQIRTAQGSAVALEVAEKFLAWKNAGRRNFNIQDIKNMLPELRKEVKAMGESQEVVSGENQNNEQKASFSDMKEKLNDIKDADVQPGIGIRPTN